MSSIVEKAKELLAQGNVYPKGCSEFVCKVLGIPWEPAKSLMGEKPTDVGFDNNYAGLSAGDIVGWKNQSNSSNQPIPDHVAIFVGEPGTQFIDVKEPGAKPRSLKNGYGKVSHLFKSVCGFSSIIVTFELTNEACAGIVFAETSTLECSTVEDSVLADARKTIAAIAYKRQGNGCAKPKVPTASELANPVTKRIWDKCNQASKDGKNIDVGKKKHFVIWYSDDSGRTPAQSPKIQADWPYTHSDKICKSFGPFKSNSPLHLWDGGSSSTFALASHDSIYVFQYDGVP